jgi:sialate O-acetylesterase
MAHAEDRPVRPYLILLAMVLMSLPARLCAGELTLLAVYTDHLVLQRDQPVFISGRAAKNAEVTLTFAGQTVSGKADSGGAWRIALAPMSASSESRTLLIRSGVESLTLHDVLVGDVWLCSGQSNMDRPLRAYNQLAPALAGVNLPTVRLFAVDHTRNKTPQDLVVPDAKLNASWQICSEPYLSHFSPIGYFFGARMNKELGVPIGIIKAGQGATTIEPWVPQPVLAKLGMDSATDPKDMRAELYNGMIHPLRQVTLKGVLWSQGESNAKDPVSYSQLFPGLISGWRAAFARPDLPFIFAQLASYGSSFDGEGDLWAYLREAQAKALVLPRTSMVVAIDAGEFEDIHPQAKEIVAERMVRQALALDGRSLIASGPRFKAMQVQGDRCIITFDHLADGLRTKEVVMNRQKNLPLSKDPQAFVVPADRLAGFTISGADGIFHPAQARIVGATVEVSAANVPAPVAVRYGWANFALCNLYNSEGLPAEPFRTDQAPVPVWERKRKP